MYYKNDDAYDPTNSGSVNKTPTGRPVSNFTKWLENQTQTYRESQGWYPMDSESLLTECPR